MLTQLFKYIKFQLGTSFRRGELLVMVNIAQTIEEAQEKLKEVLENGKALQCFYKMLLDQGVQRSVAEELCYGDGRTVLPTATNITKFPALSTGYVKAISAKNIATVSWRLGAGRSKPSDSLDYAVGAVLLTTIGSHIDDGDNWIEIHHNLPLTEDMKQMIDDSIEISDHTIPLQDRVIEIL